METKILIKKIFFRHNKQEISSFIFFPTTSASEVIILNFCPAVEHISQFRWFLHLFQTGAMDDSSVAS